MAVYAISGQIISGQTISDSQAIKPVGAATFQDEPSKRAYYGHHAGAAGDVFDWPVFN